MKEYILCAANYYNDGKEYVHQPKNITVGYVVCGRRHHNIISLLGQVFDTNSRHCEQGFLTNTDRFVDRIEAMEIATKAGQVNNTRKDKLLFSEDLY